MRRSCTAFQRSTFWTTSPRFAAAAPDLIVESAHPDITRSHGEAFLSSCDYMPFSVTALADDGLRERLTTVAKSSGHRLVIPQGALVGTDALLGWAHMWRDVTITFRKHPANIDLGMVNRRAEDIRAETVIFDGPVRDIAPLFPRNVNTMVTCALATVGIDRCRGRMIADPAPRSRGRGSRGVGQGRLLFDDGEAAADGRRVGHRNVRLRAAIRSQGNRRGPNSGFPVNALAGC